MSGVPRRLAGQRTIAVLTTGRQDWGILHSTCVALRDHPDLRLRLLVGGTHLSPGHGATADFVRADGFVPDAIVVPDDPDVWAMPATDLAAGTLAAIGAELRAHPVDALVLAGDRFETAAAALAATIERVPIAHIHGGEQTLGAFDDALRHAITKLAHLHLVSHEEHARRVLAMGEDPGAVHVVGAPGLDAARRPDLPDRAALEADLGIALRPPVVIVTVHPATLDPDPAAVAGVVAAAMDLVPATYVVTLPNADPGSAEVRATLLAASGRPDRVGVEALGERRYWGLMRIADAMLGNSSSALVEAPAVDLPAVDVGERQAGRRREGNVIPAAADPERIADALRRALDPATRDGIARSRDGRLDGRAGQRITDIIAAWQPPRPPRKPPIPVDR